MKLTFSLVICLLPCVLFAQKETKLNDKPVMLQAADEPFRYFKVESHNGRYGIINSSTYQEIIPFEYNSIEKVSDVFPYFIAMKNGKYGVLNAKGDSIIKFEYDELRLYNLSSISYYDHAPSDTSFMFKAKKNGRYGFINIKNKPLLPLEYEQIDYKMNDFFPALKGGKWGTVNMKSVIKIPFQYDGMESMKSVYKVKQQGLNGIISNEGEVLLPVKYTSINVFKNSKRDFTPYYIITDNNAKQGIWDTKTNTLLLPVKYDRIADVCESNFIVVVNNKYGINSNIPPQYDTLKCLSVKDGKQPLLAMIKGKYALINANNEKLTDFQYDDIQSISAGFYKVEKNHRYSIIDAHGKPTTNKEYDNIGIFRNGQATVYQGKEIGLISTTGVAHHFNPSSASGYADLEMLFEDFATAMNSNNDSIMRMFCIKATPDKHTVEFLEESRYRGTPLLHDLQTNAYTLEDIVGKWMFRLQRCAGELKDKRLLGNLKYQGNNETYIESEEFCVEAVRGATKFSAGDKGVKIKLGGLMRIDGVWKAFALPSID